MNYDACGSCFVQKHKLPVSEVAVLQLQCYNFDPFIIK